jgi:hypothetical protein
VCDEHLRGGPGHGQHGADSGTVLRERRRDGLQHVAADTLRTLLARRLPIQTVQRLMRHGDIRRTVNLYLDLGLDDLAGEVAKLPSLFDASQVPLAVPQGAGGGGSVEAAAS